MLGGQRHAPHRPLKQLVRTDNVGAGRRCRGWERESAAGKGKGRRAALEGCRANRDGGVGGGGGKQRGGVLKQRRMGRSHVTDRWTDR